MNSNKPSWLKVRLPVHHNFFGVAGLLKKQALHTICQSARCPNMSECWTNRTATFLILGDVCTRACGFCAVKKGTPGPLSPDEPAHVAEAVAELGLEYTVITSVTRDDLPDGGASVFAETIRAVRGRKAGVRIEVLIPDFQGREEDMRTVVEAGPDILNHNLETPEVMYPRINRPQTNYRRSLRVLESAKVMGAVTKSGLMIGLGETEEDILRAFSDLRGVSCDLLTIGQYLRPTKEHAPVVKYHHPEEFERLKTIALESGFRDVESGPLVRSSYRAHKLYQTFRQERSGGACTT